MERFLIDTNAISYYLTNSLPENGMKFMDVVIDKIPNLSVITQIEILCWNTTETKKVSIENFY